MANRSIVTALLALLLAAATVGQADADARATLQVSARVLPWLSSEMVQQIFEYRVSAADLRRGFVDLPGALLFRYRSNGSTPIDLQLDSLGPAPVVLLETGSTVAEVQLTAGGAPLPQERRFDLRVLLPAGATPGVYPLQLLATAALGS